MASKGNRWRNGVEIQYVAPIGLHSGGGGGGGHIAHNQLLCPKCVWPPPICPPTDRDDHSLWKAYRDRMMYSIVFEAFLVGRCKQQVKNC